MIMIRSLAIFLLLVCAGCGVDGSTQPREGTFTTPSGDVVTVDKDYRVTSHLTNGVVHSVVTVAEDNATLAEADYDVSSRVWTFAIPGQPPKTVPQNDEPELSDPTALMTRINQVAITVVGAASFGIDVGQNAPAKDAEDARDDCANSAACITINGKKACTSDCTDIGYCNGSFAYYDACCASHDVCYIVYDCSAWSWLSLDMDCQGCNAGAVSCFAKKVGGGLDE